MAFKLVSTPDESDIILVGTNGTTVAVGDVLWLSTGSTYYIADNTAIGIVEQWNNKVIAAETGDTTKSSIKGILVHPQQIWEVSSTNNSNSSHNGDRMVPTSRSEINNTGTNSTAANALVIQLEAIGAASDKRILVRFIGTDGADPAIT